MKSKGEILVKFVARALDTFMPIFSFFFIFPEPHVAYLICHPLRVVRSVVSDLCRPNTISPFYLSDDSTIYSNSGFFHTLNNYSHGSFCQSNVFCAMKKIIIPRRSRFFCYLFIYFKKFTEEKIIKIIKKIYLFFSLWYILILLLIFFWTAYSCTTRSGRRFSIKLVSSYYE